MSTYEVMQNSTVKKELQVRDLPQKSRRIAKPTSSLCSVVTQLGTKPPFFRINDDSSGRRI